VESRATRGHSLLNAKREAIDACTIQVLEDELRETVFSDGKIKIRRKPTFIS